MKQLTSVKKPIIVGVTGKELLEHEIKVFTEHHPLGVVLFQRNVETEEQVKKLIASIEEILGYKPLICIDIEGDVVNRLKDINASQEQIEQKIHNQDYVWPSQGSFGEKYDKAMTQGERDEVKKEVYVNYEKIAKKLLDLGITCDLAPVLDIPYGVFDSRSFSKSIDTVIELGKVAVEALIKNGIVPVLKHAPGLGPSPKGTDSHEKTPIVPKSFTLEQLEIDHLRAFKEVVEYIRFFNKTPVVMLGHIIYECLDPKMPASFSVDVLKYLKNQLGDKVIYITDDLAMKGATSQFADFQEMVESCLFAGTKSETSLIPLFCHELTYEENAIKEFNKVIAQVSPIGNNLIYETLVT